MYRRSIYDRAHSEQIREHDAVGNISPRRKRFRRDLVYEVYCHGLRKAVGHLLADSGKPDFENARELTPGERPEPDTRVTADVDSGVMDQ